MPLLDLNNKEEVNKFNQYLKKSDHASITQAKAWAHIKNTWKPFYVYLEENGDIIASMSILTVNALDGKKLAYATRGPVCDVYDVELVDRLYDEAEKYLKEENIFLLRTDPEIKYDKELAEKYEQKGFKVRNLGIDPHSTIQPRLNVRIDLKGQDEESVMASFHKKTRYNIRLAGRKDLEVRYSSNNIEDIHRFFEVHKIMSERQGIGHRDVDYFIRMAEAYGDDLRVYTIWYEGQVLSAAICISHANTTWYAYGGSSNEHRNRMPNYLMQWEMIKWALERGTRYYDFGGFFEKDIEDGLYRFKSGFVADEDFDEFIGEIDRVYDEEVYEKFINK